MGNSGQSSWGMMQIVMLMLFLLGFGFFYFTKMNLPLPAVENVACSACHGTGRVECLFCQGRGYNQKLNLSSWNGKGGGSGPSSKTELCSSCNGNGWKPCVTCNGKGTVLQAKKGN